MSQSGAPVRALLKRMRPWIFPLVCVTLYGVAFTHDPGRTFHSLHEAGQILKRLVLPLSIALTIMILLNRFLSPSWISRLLGQGAGFRGVLLSTVAGILSMGPIYAWYPLFKTLKDTGASPFNVANFMCNRSVKPVLIPVLVGYFGWKLSGMLILMNLIGSLTTAAVVGLVFSLGKKEWQGE